MPKVHFNFLSSGSSCLCLNRWNDKDKAMSAQKGTLPSASLPRVGATVLITQTIKSERGYFVNQLIATRPKQNHPPSSVCAGIFTDCSYDHFLYKPRDVTNKSDFNIGRPELTCEVCGSPCAWRGRPAACA